MQVIGEQHDPVGYRHQDVAPQFGLNGDRRIWGGSVSMGADEIAIAERRIYLPVVLRQ